MSRKILAFYSPYPGAGKSTAAEYVFRDVLLKSRLAFADPLYKITTKDGYTYLKNDAALLEYRESHKNIKYTVIK